MHKALEEPKAYLHHLLLLAKPEVGETLYTYLAATHEAISLILIKEVAPSNSQSTSLVKSRKELS